MRKRGKKAVNQAGLNQDDILSLQIRLPGLSDQQRIARQLEQAVVGRVERLRAIQREALRQADHLFASLLDRAFSE